jgi:hypothetical protein
MKPVALVGVGALLSWSLPGALAQENARVTDLFLGTVLLQGRAGADEAQVDIQKWIVNNRSRVALPKVERGLLVVQLQAGSVRTVGQDGRVRRLEGDRWTIGPGEAAIVETGEDSAILRLTTVREP